MNEKFNDRYYKPYKEMNYETYTVYLYADDDLYERALTVDLDDNIISDEPTGDCGCRSCRESA